MIPRFDSSVFPGVASQVQGSQVTLCLGELTLFSLEGMSTYLAYFPSSSGKYTVIDDGSAASPHAHQWRRRLPQIFAGGSEDAP